MTRRECLAMMTAAVGATLTAGFLRAEDASALLRVAASIDTLAGANINDARVAYRIWVEEAFRQYGKVTGELVPEVFLPSEVLIRDIRQGSIHGYVVTAFELARVVDLTDPESIVLQDYQADGTEYVILVHKNSPYMKLADLRGAQVVAHHHRDMLLFKAWLENLLAENNLPGPERFFAGYKLNDGLNQVLLPVFFQRANAACLARRSWDTAMELNPQIGRDLRPVAVSPKVIPIALGLRRNSNPASRKILLECLLGISRLPAGQQIAALYQSRSFVARPLSVMNTTLDMVRQHDRLLAQQAVLRKVKS